MYDIKIGIGFRISIVKNGFLHAEHHIFYSNQFINQSFFSITNKNSLNKDISLKKSKVHKKLNLQL